MLHDAVTTALTASPSFDASRRRLVSRGNAVKRCNMERVAGGWLEVFHGQPSRRRVE